MAFTTITSPHTTRALSTADVMRLVILATIPGIAALTWFFGIGTLINIALSITTALACEAAVLALRKRPVSFYLKDYTAVVTAVLLGIALPPYAPWWLAVVGSATAIILAKQLYGGLGFNPFNPAMVGYVVLLISFPVEMTQWAAPITISQNGMGVVDALQQVFLGAQIDGWSGATPLDAFKQNDSLLVEQLYQQETIFSSGQWAGAGWEWVNAAFLVGGAFLLYKKVFTWHAPIAMLVTLLVCSLFGYDGGSSHSQGSAVLHLLSGGTMLGAFFILTDPVSSAVSNRGRLIFGAGAGLLIYVIRVWGNYPDAVAFAVLLMNFAAPFIDYYTLPRAYGHKKSHKATKKLDV